MPSSFSHLAGDISEFLFFYGVKFQFSNLYENKMKNKFAKIYNRYYFKHHKYFPTGRNVKEFLGKFMDKS